MTIVAAEEIHEFWFGPLDTEGRVGTLHRERWFAPSTQFDGEINERFSATLAAAHGGKLDPWLEQPKSWLSFLLLCDQFPRNMYRGQARAFASDRLALQAAQQGLAQCLDTDLCIDERAFAYLPFEHSEDRVHQFLAVGLFVSLRDQAAKADRSTAGNYLRYAQQHRDVILRFGRFPHRNAALSRSSTEAELEYLAEGGGFG